MSMKKLYATAAASVVLFAVTPAMASTALDDSVANVGKNLVSVPQLINYASYIIGVALGVAGVSKLKAHVDAPSNNPIKDGLGRIAAAAMFISLPYMLSLAQKTSNMGSDANAFKAIAEPTGL